MAAPLSSRTFEIGDQEVRENWDKRLFRQYIHKTALFNPANKFVSDDEESLIVRKKEVFAEGGTRATITLTKKLVGSPTHGTQTMEDREEGLDTETFRWEIQKIRHAVRVDGEITENRVTWNVIKTSAKALGEWFAERQEGGGFMHLAGFNIDGARPTTEPWLQGNDLGATWGNAPVRPDDDHLLRVNNKNPESMASTDFMDLGIFHDAKALGETLPQPIRPVRIYGDDYFLVFVHPYTVRMWKEAGTRWWELAKAAIQGGMINGNPYVRGTLGVIDGMIFMGSNYVPPAINSGGTAAVVNTRSAIFCGQAALLYGVAKRYPDERTFRTVNMNKDYGDKVRTEAHTLGGLATPQFAVYDSTVRRYSTIVIDGYAKDLKTPA